MHYRRHSLFGYTSLQHWFALYWRLIWIAIFLHRLPVLQPVQVAVVAVFFGQKFLMAALLDNLPFVHGDDAVGHAHGGEAVGDDEYGAVAADGLHLLHDGAFGFVVQRAGGFV